jgi:hypothetical protein
MSQHRDTGTSKQSGSPSGAPATGMPWANSRPKQGTSNFSKAMRSQRQEGTAQAVHVYDTSRLLYDTSCLTTNIN